MKKLLIAGGSHADIPIIQAAQKMGYFVITSGNNPEDYGHHFSDQYYPEDYSNPKKILNLARLLNIDVICPSANDFSALSCAYTAEKLGLHGHDTYETSLTLHHKDKFRHFALTNNIRVPKAISIKKESNYDIDLHLSYPLIIKPVDLSGGKGITKVYSKKELKSAIEQAFLVSRSNSIVIEEFIEGTNHGYSTFIKDKKIVFAFMDDEHYFVNPYMVSGASTSLHYNQTIALQLNNDLEKIAKLLNLKDGLLHVQFILKNNIPYIIEVCRRTPGDLYVNLVKYATGFDMPKAIIESFTQEYVEPYTIHNIQYITRHCVMSHTKGYIKSILYGELESKIFDKMSFYTQGDYISNPMTYKAEIDFIKYQDKLQMQSLQPKITSNIKVELLP
jgi:biotin carboxylase